MSKFKDRLSKGMCGHCGIKKHKLNHTMCSGCLKKTRERQKKSQQSRRNRCLCLDCGIKITSGLRCDTCRKKRNSLKAIDRKNRLLGGLCCDCHKPVNKHKCRCDKCHDKMHAILSKKREDRKNSGLCVRCGKFKKIHNLLCCEVCYFKIACVNAKMGASNWRVLQDVFNGQSGICPYTKRKITIGVDASLDHKIPTSKGGDNNPSNIQWVYDPVNVMKLDHSEDGFFELIKILYESNKERMLC
jgi:hypothetical protein